MEVKDDYVGSSASLSDHGEIEVNTTPQMPFQPNSEVWIQARKCFTCALSRFCTFSTGITRIRSVTIVCIVAVVQTYVQSFRDNVSCFGDDTRLRRLVVG